MDIRELRKILKSSGSVLVLENNEPDFIILDYDFYKRSLEETKVDKVPDTAGLISVGQAASAKEAEIMERLNKEILTLKQQIETEEREIENI